MLASKRARKMPVFPRMIEMVVRIVRARIMPDPLSICMNVRRIRMSLLIRI